MVMLRSAEPASAAARGWLGIESSGEQSKKIWPALVALPWKNLRACSTHFSLAAPFTPAATSPTVAMGASPAAATPPPSARVSVTLIHSQTQRSRSPPPPPPELAIAPSESVKAPRLKGEAMSPSQNEGQNIILWGGGEVKGAGKKGLREMGESAG